MATKTYCETLQFLSEYVTPTERTEAVPLEEALGFVLAEDLVSKINLPLFDNSAMDGWAFSSEDIRPEGFELTEVGKSFAGHPFDRPLCKGECVRIMTGGEVPEGADTVVKQEIIKADGNHITFPEGVRAGENVRKKGEEISVGDVCMKKGRLLQAPQINYLAALGFGSVPVFSKIRVGFFSTGDELQPIGRPLEKGRIFDSNRIGIGAMLREAGFACKDYGLVPDDPAVLKSMILKASAECDALITSGGVSVGEADFTRAVLEEVGKLVDWKCQIKPGKPMAIGKIGGCLFLGLPGNPTAAQVTFYAIGLIGLRILSGETEPKLPLYMARSEGALKKSPGYTDFQRGIVTFANGEVLVRSAGSQKGGAMVSMNEANCLIYLSHDADRIREGDLLPVVPLVGLCS